MQAKDVLKRYKDDLHVVEETLAEHYRSHIQLIPEITNHIIHSGGKRLRPLLLMITSDLCGYTGARRYSLAATLEFLHTASLFHDDVIDLADTRRGKTSANTIWGNSASVLVGDFLYSQAFKLIVADGDPAVQKLLTETTITMVEGETAQLVTSGNPAMTEEDYLSIVEKKTAVLISTSCSVSALLAGVPASHVNALGTFGMNLGIAFQVTDDTLDYVAAEEELGKTIGMDIKEGKITLPLIRTLQKCTTAEKTLIETVLASPGSDGERLKDVKSLIDKYDGIDYALGKAADFIREGKTYLEVFDDSPPKEALIAISDYIIGRRH